MNHHNQPFALAKSERLFSIQGGVHLEVKKKKVLAKHNKLVDVVLERKGSQMFEGRRICSLQDAFQIFYKFIGDCDCENFVVVMKVVIISNSTGIIVAHGHPSGENAPSQED